MAARPRTLRRYIGLRFLAGILGTFLLCCVLIFMIDIVELLRQSGKYGSVPAWKLAGCSPAPAGLQRVSRCVRGAGRLDRRPRVHLSRKSELTIMRAGGMSVWQFLRPGVVVAFLLGLAGILAYNPLAAKARDTAERVYAEAFGKDANILKPQAGSVWLRQDGADGQSVITAAASSRRGLTLSGVTIFVFDADERFVERVDGAKAELKEGYWEIREAGSRASAASPRSSTPTCYRPISPRSA